MRRNTAAVFVCVIALAFAVGAQGQEFARVLRNGEHATLSAFGPRPLDLAATKLVDEFGMALNVEDPVYLSRDDIEEIGTARSDKPPKQGMSLLAAFFSIYSILNPDVTGSFRMETAERFVSSRVTLDVHTGVGQCAASPEMRGVS